MRKIAKLAHRFVEFIPEGIEEGVLYVSMDHATAIHKCCCGCGNEVVTPLSPTDWTLIYDGTSITLHPSIGNWGSACQSHYWIRGDSVIWAGRWSKRRIEAARIAARHAKEEYFDSIAHSESQLNPGHDDQQPNSAAKTKKPSPHLTKRGPIGE
jgi:hypothetical protein